MRMPMNFLSDLRDFFFPRLCLTCGTRLLNSEDCFCLSCMADLPYTNIGNVPGNEVEKYFWGRFPVERATSVFYYTKDGNVAHILYAMKYYGRYRLCEKMGKLMAHELLPTGFFEGIDGIVPVPLHKSRLRERGYNQSALLAKGLSGELKIPVWEKALVRMRNNATQTHKSAFERWQNADRLFQPAKDACRLEGKHVLLVDDVLTTGATLVACADALSEIKDIRISVITLAWAK